MENREKAMYILGFLLFLFAAFFGRDISDQQELVEGIIILIGFMGIAVLAVYVSRRGGIGYPIR
ncbi:hypothetical protein GF326_12880 [Candidatus Bathyarchaeota archaeon]|nr:hypothetical protein [Candidatus Bathyarchaeota archaeon]